LVSSPEVLILDEPDTYIDRKTKTGLYQLLEEVNKETAIVLVSHDLGAILQNVRSIACVDETLHYHPQAEIPEEWLDEETGCPIDLIGHGHHPHRILKHHATDE
jgi:zinc transport system ATP-binding protein